jgi:hypothetical protein
MKCLAEAIDVIGPQLETVISLKYRIYCGCRRIWRRQPPHLGRIEPTGGVRRCQKLGSFWPPWTWQISGYQWSNINVHLRELVLGCLKQFSGEDLP